MSSRSPLRAIAAGLLAAAALAAAPASAEPVTVAEVRVVGEESLPLAEIRRMIPIKAGGTLDAARLERITRMLDDLGFVRAQVELVAGEAGEILEVRVERLPFVTEVDFEGIFPIFHRTALNVLRMRPGDVLERDKLEEEVRRLEDLAEREGFFGTTCAVDTLPDGTDAELLYRCRRGHLLSPRIEVRGARALPAEEVADDLSPWFIFTRDALNERVEQVVQRYREMGWVRARVRVLEVEPRVDERVVDVVVEVDEGKRLELHLSGNRALDDDEIEEVLPFAREGGHGFFLVEEGAEAIRSAYQGAGYPEAKVDFHREPSDERVVVTYEIEEGPRADLAGVVFAGNEGIGDDTLRDLVAATSRRWLVLPPRWSDGKLERDRVAVESLYRERGYARVAVAPPELERVERDGEVEVRARFRIEEGARYTISTLEVAGVPSVVAPAVSTVRLLAPEQPYRASAVRAEQVALEKALQARGYLTARVEREESFDEERAQVAVRLVALAGARFRTGPVLRVGPRFTAPGVIDDALDIHEGRILTPSALGSTQENLRDLRVFESIRLRLLGLPARGQRSAEAAPQTTAAEAAPKVPVLVELRESDRIQLDLGFGYDTDRGGAVRFTASHGNLLGRAMRLTARGKLGERDREVALGLAYPRLLGTDVTGSIDTAYEDRDLEAFDEEVLSVGGALTRELAPDLTGSIGLRYRLSDVTNVTGEDPDAPEEGFSRALLWTASLVRDTRDNLLYPSEGSFLSLAAALSSTRLVSDDDFVRFDVQARRYWTLFDGVVGVLSGRFTDVETFGRTDEVPTPELLFAGGANSVRGFEEDRLGPLDDDGNPLGGGTRVIANAELRFPLVWILEGAAFVDAGSIVREIGDLDLDEVQVAAGGGIRARSPVGPIRFDLGYQLEDNAPLDRWEFHFSFGYPF